MRDFESRMAERKQRWEQRMERSPGRGHIWTGVLLLLIGIIALLKTSIVGFPEWLFSWQVLLIVLGLFIGLRHRFHGAAWFVLLLIGSIFLVNDYFIEGNIRRHIWPVVIIIIGVFFIIRSRNQNSSRDWYEKKNAETEGEKTGTALNEPYSNDNYVDTTSIFGGTKKNILSKKFVGGDIVNVFGGTELNLSQADMVDSAVLEITTIFGGTKLIVPSNWAIKSEAVTIFGGIEDKRQLPPVGDMPAKTLILRGTVIFGGIDIKNF